MFANKVELLLGLALGSLGVFFIYDSTSDRVKAAVEDKLVRKLEE